MKVKVDGFSGGDRLDVKLPKTQTDLMKKVKELGKPIMLVSHYPVNWQVQEMVDYYVYDKHNPLTTHSYYTLFYNRSSDYDVDLNINGLHNGNQSLTVLTNMFNGFKHAKECSFEQHSI